MPRYTSKYDSTIFLSAPLLRVIKLNKSVENVRGAMDGKIKKSQLQKVKVAHGSLGL